MSYEIKENAYGHLKRVNWFEKRLSRSDSICEIGCGTGAMIVLPLAQKGFNIVGFDLDEESISYGKELFKKEEISAELFATEEFIKAPAIFDVVIVSEVMEHLNDDEYPSFFQLLRKKLKPNGKLLVTVPNGYGCFEIENYLYYKIKLGKLLDKLKITYKLDQFKNFILKRKDWVNTVPSTFNSTPHVQKFTYGSIQKLLRSYQFKINAITGSVLFAGPLSDRVFSGFNPPLKLNNFLGSYLPRIASGFYVECTSFD